MSDIAIMLLEENKKLQGLLDEIQSDLYISNRNLEEKWIELSDNTDEIFAALAKAQGVMESAQKDSVGNWKNKYATLDSIWDACRKALSTNGLAIIQSPSSNGDKLIMHQMLTHSSGQYIKYKPLELKLEKITPQGVGAAITYARRYMLAGAVGVSSDEDNDAQQYEQNQAPPQPDNRPWQEKSPRIEEFLAMARQEFRIDDQDIKDELKAAGYSGYKSTDAPQMWTRFLEKTLSSGYRKNQQKNVAIVIIPDYY